MAMNVLTAHVDWSAITGCSEDTTHTSSDDDSQHSADDVPRFTSDPPSQQSKESDVSDITLSLKELLQNKSLPGHTKTLVSQQCVLNDTDGSFAIDGSVSDVLSTGVKASFFCPLARTRMMYPCRSFKCKHVQCFDAQFFLQMNTVKEKWKCPICNIPAEKNSLYIDGLMKKIIEVETEAEEILFDAEGSWSTCNFNPQSPGFNVSAVDLTDSPLVEGSDAKSSRRAQGGIVNVSVIDLCTPDTKRSKSRLEESTLECDMSRLSVSDSSYTSI